MRRIVIGGTAAVAFILLLVAVRVLVRRHWDNSVGDACYAAPALVANPPLVLQHSKWKPQPLLDHRLLDMPAPDAVVVRQGSVVLAWEAPLITWVPAQYRSSWDSYLLEVTFQADGKAVAKCHHGSD